MNQTLFSKSDLEDGKTVVEINTDGDAVKHLLIGGQLIDKDGYYFDLTSFDEDLHIGECSITKIMIFKESYMAFNVAFTEADDYSAELIWEREVQNANH